jgi:chorismate synthase
MNGGPAGLGLSAGCAQGGLDRRRPGNSAGRGPRQEPGPAKILSAPSPGGSATGAAAPVFIRGRRARATIGGETSQKHRPRHSSWTPSGNAGSRPSRAEAGRRFAKPPPARRPGRF